MSFFGGETRAARQTKGERPITSGKWFDPFIRQNNDDEGKNADWYLSRHE